jgi:hypothetical protein
LYDADCMLEWVATKDVTPKRVVSRVGQNGAAAVETWSSLVCERLLYAPAGFFEMRLLHRRPLWTVGAVRTAVCALGKETSRNIRSTVPARIPLAVPLLHADECVRHKETRANPSPSSYFSVFVSAAGWLLLRYENRTGPAGLSKIVRARHTRCCCCCCGGTMLGTVECLGRAA